jgi:hypothetical protein
MLRFFPLPKSLSQGGRGTLKGVYSPFSRLGRKGLGDGGRSWRQVAYSLLKFSLSLNPFSGKKRDFCIEHDSTV